MLVLDYDQLLAVPRNGAERDHPSNGPSSPMEDCNRELANACVEAMGPNGCGFVAVRGMKDYANLRNQVLLLAQRLALMPNSERATILKEQGLGSDVSLKDPRRPVSSFAAQLRFDSPSELDKIDGCSLPETQWSSHGHSLSDLGSLFKQLGMCMVEVGLLVARLCDITRSHGSMREGGLAHAILESGTAKGRLIHYHSLLEQRTLSYHKNLRKGHRQNKSANRWKEAEVSNPAADSGGSVSSRWQEWHCDYGIFTVLTAPLFLKPTKVVPNEADDSVPETPHCLNSSVNECAPPDQHSSLLVRDSDGRTTCVVVPSDYLVIQAGEAAQLLSGGELVARAHCVMRPHAADDVSRETMAVFLQPAWDRRMSLPPGVPPQLALEAGVATNLTHIPLLAARWKEGCTFAQLSKETTRQYYGAHGQQSRLASRGLSITAVNRSQGSAALHGKLGLKACFNNQTTSDPAFAELQRVQFKDGPIRLPDLHAPECLHQMANMVFNLWNPSSNLRCHGTSNPVNQ